MKFIPYIFIFFIIISITAYGQMFTSPEDGKTYDVGKIKYNSMLEKENNIGRLILDGDISLLNRKIDYLSLATLDKKELKILRNSIYAQYGYIFKSNELSDYFSKFKWYSAQNTNVNLSNIDIDNISTILLFEKQDSNITLNINENNLIGWWQDLNGIAAGYSRRIVFFEKNKYIFIYSEMRDLPEIISFSGNYEINGNILKLSITEKKIADHTDKFYCGPPNGCDWTDFKLKTIKLSKVQYLTFPISNIEPNENNNYILQTTNKINIGGKYFYKFNKCPEDKYK